MPTMRLGDSERGSIKRAFARVAKKAKNNKPFPLTEDDFPDFGYSLLDPRIAKHYEFLRDEAEDLTQASTYSPDFRIRDEFHEYKISFYRVELPKDGLRLEETHSMYADILKWAQEQWEVDVRVRESLHYLYKIVDHCSSTGQIKRVLQDEIIRFVPEYMQNTFKDAERKSRVPRNLNLDAERLEELANMLALGSISPEERDGLHATVDSRKDI